MYYVTFLIVSVPYEITLLSNRTCDINDYTSVSVPYEITLLSNTSLAKAAIDLVSVPYEITLLSNAQCSILTALQFQYLMKLHYSQTGGDYMTDISEFQYLMKLHYSQTSFCLG